jgi:tetratricopeptide (TPR) repeat protein
MREFLISAARNAGGFLLALLLSANAWSAATLKGLVMLNREGGEPMAGVAISADGANQDITRNDGSFTLSFPNRNPGQEVRVIVTRPGWVAVNDIQLQRPLPEPTARPLEIILCKSEEREPWTLLFFRLKGAQTVEQQYQRQLAERQGRHAATAEERDRLARERDQALKQADELARQLAAKAPTDSSYREAVRLFLDGQLDAALQRLTEERLDWEVADARKKLDEAAQGWLLRGKLLTLRFDFAGAGRAYGKVVKVVPESYDAWFQYAEFHQGQNGYPEARQGYERALALAREARDTASVANTLNNMGILHSDENRMAEARKAYEEALAIYRKLAGKNPDGYLPDVAMTLNNLGNLHRAENRLAEARKAYEEALAIYRKLAGKNPDVYLPDVAMTLNNLGILHGAENRLAEARKAYAEALAIRRKLAEKNPDVYLPNVALTLNNLGVLHGAENRMAEARKAFEEALAIRRKLAEKNPDVYLPNVALTLNNLGVLHRDENHIAEARKAYEEALAIYRRFAATAPATYEPYLRKVETDLVKLPK